MSRFFMDGIGLKFISERNIFSWTAKKVNNLFNFGFFPSSWRIQHEFIDQARDILKNKHPKSTEDNAIDGSSEGQDEINDALDLLDIALQIGLNSRARNALYDVAEAKTKIEPSIDQRKRAYQILMDKYPYDRSVFIGYNEREKG